MKVDFNKYPDRLVPAIIQDADNGDVLMLGFMDEGAFAQTRETGRVTFYSRSRQRLWTKGETSGNFLSVVSIRADCDNDTLLITAVPKGPVCHMGQETCFGPPARRQPDVLAGLEKTIDDRRRHKPEGSYVTSLFASGINKIAQKVGEEAVELVIEAKDDDREKFIAEAADLLFHYLVLLRAKDLSHRDVLDELQRRMPSE
jgi:phosphoribosyl-ATP pyrophosphohydrolase/phosphoribosyl-AMP cyclohydrolase